MSLQWNGEHSIQVRSSKHTGRVRKARVCGTVSRCLQARQASNKRQADGLGQGVTESSRHLVVEFHIND